MTFWYEGVDVDKTTRDLAFAPIESIRANNIIVVAQDKIKQLRSIAQSYNQAFKFFAEFKTANPNPNAKGYNAALFNRLRNDLNKWKETVTKNGGKFKQGTADFSDKINKLNQDIKKYQPILKTFSGIVPLPSAAEARDFISKDAKATTAANKAKAEKEAKIANQYEDGLKELTAPGASKDTVTPAKVGEVLYIGVATGKLVWNLVTLKLLAGITPQGHLVSSSDLSKLAKEIPKGAAVNTVRSRIMDLIRKNKEMQYYASGQAEVDKKNGVVTIRDLARHFDTTEQELRSLTSSELGMFIETYKKDMDKRNKQNNF